MIQNIHLKGYRSLSDLRLKLAQVTVLRGPNGVGKSNVYRALRLLSSLADGSFARAVADEGGMPSLLWAGNEKVKRTTHLELSVETDIFKYELDCGLMPQAPNDPNPFKLDPDIKTESLKLGGRVVGKRNRAQFRVTDSRGKFGEDQPIDSAVSMLTPLRDAQNYPGLLHARNTLAAWRFYDSIRTDPAAPPRQAVRGYWSPVLAEDASNLPAVVASIAQSDQATEFREALALAFPQARLQVTCDRFFELSFISEHLPRPLTGAELSDGTLRFICLAAALCSPQPPPLLVLNEPESSLNESLIPALATLIAKAAERSQIVIVTHSTVLSQAIAALTQTRQQALVMVKGETRLQGYELGRRVYIIDEEDEDE
ncbi:MAG: AAA family ATPase [Verrucomicrobiales bacterium]|nr:AAA family ATPase [Verrucomicrobiales bacterium]MCP5559987.1 AAA family ATPase [Verrucomicrobiaceae bacterium]